MQPQQPQQAAPQPQQGGGLGDFLSRIGPAIAMIDPRNQALGAALMQANMGRQKERKNQQVMNQTASWLQKQGVGADESAFLAGNPDALNAWYKQYKTGSQPDWQMQEIYDDQGNAQKVMMDMKTGKYNKIGGAKAEGGGATSDMKEYDAAVKQGFKGTLMDFMVKMKEAGRNQVNIDTGTKLPSGYMWKDPANQALGVVPIPGGPATQLPSEAAGRIGLADSFLGNFDAIRKKVDEGQVTGPIDRFRATNDSSYEGAETYRQIQTGVDSLQRMLTGAGMPASEAAQYAFRYLPTYTDNNTSMVEKLDRLKSELEGVQKRVMQGRQADAPQDAPKNAPQIGETRYGYRFKGGDPSEPSNWEKAQ